MQNVTFARNKVRALNLLGVEGVEPYPFFEIKDNTIVDHQSRYAISLGAVCARDNPRSPSLNARITGNSFAFAASVIGTRICILEEPSGCAGGTVFSNNTVPAGATEWVKLTSVDCGYACGDDQA